MTDLFSVQYAVPLIGALGAVFLLREILVLKNIIPAKYLLTPLITLLIVIIAVLSIRGGSIERYGMMIIAGLLLSLVADTLLMIVEVDLLKYGIVFFLFAHVAYIIAFTGGYSFCPWNIVPAVLLAAGVVLFYFRIRGKTGGLDIPVTVYAAVLAVMTFFALTMLNAGAGSREILAAAGGVLFMISDLIISVNAFIFETPHSTVIVWSLYAPAQFLLALSCW